MPEANVLVVDDCADTRRLLKLLLEAKGFRVDCAANGQEALARLRHDKPPCLILTDLHMPIMDGETFCQELRHDPVLASIPLMVISGEIDVAEIAASLKVEIYFRKPVTPFRLLNAVRQKCP